MNDTVPHAAEPAPECCVVVPAGGRGARMGGPVPKQFLELGGVPLLVVTLRNLLRCPLVQNLVVVAPAEELERTAALLEEHGVERVIGPVAGGATRLASVKNGIARVPESAGVIAVHDAARPFPDPAVLEAAIRRAAQGVGVVVGRPAADTIKQVRDGRVTATPERASLWQAFTPQVFPAKMIACVYRNAAPDDDATDDAQLMERAGHPVEMIEGGAEALKVTTPRDLVTARAWLELAGEEAEPGTR